MTKGFQRGPFAGAVVAAVTAWLTAASGILIADRIVAHIALQDLRGYLGHTAAAAAALIDGDGLARFTQRDQDATPDYEEASRPLRVLLATNPDIRFAYTGVAAGTKMRFVLDGTPVGARSALGVDEHSAPGAADDATPGEIEVTRSHRLTVEREPSPSAWGMGIRAAAPIFNHTGVMVGFAGITMSADHYYSMLRRSDRAALIGVLGAALLAATFGMFVWRVEARKHRAETAQQRLETQLIRERDQVRQYARDLDRADESARQRIAADLHDGISQVLVGQGMLLSSARLKVLDEPVRSLIDAAAKASRAALAEIRAMMQFLNPPASAYDSLEDSFDWLAESFDRRYQFAVDWRVVGEGEVATDLRLLLLRVVRELIFNAYRYSGRQGVRVAATIGPEFVEVVVADDGVGFDPARIGPREDGGFGLVHARERVGAAGGTFEVDSAPGSGCRIRARVPRQGVPRDPAA